MQDIGYKRSHVRVSCRQRLLGSFQLIGQTNRPLIIENGTTTVFDAQAKAKLLTAK